MQYKYTNNTKLFAKSYATINKNEIEKSAVENEPYICYAIY